MMRKNLLVLLLVLLALPTASAAIAAEGVGSWVQVSLGVNGMAMDDINEADFRWHEESPDGFNLNEINSGMALSFGVGYDMSPAIGYGFFWEHQYASSNGMDQEMEADVNLAADIFSGRVNFNFIRKEKWRLGVAGSMGFLVAGGDVNKTTAGASYGSSDLSGNCMTFEGMANLEIITGGGSIVQINGGWRQAEVTSFKNGSAPVQKPDGENMSLDYSGFTARVGLKFRFGDMADQTVQDIN